MKEDLYDIKFQILDQEANLNKFITDLYYFSTLLESLKQDFRKHWLELKTFKSQKNITFEEYQTSVKKLKSLYQTKINDLKQDINAIFVLCANAYESNVAFQKEYKNDIKKLNKKIKQLDKTIGLQTSENGTDIYVKTKIKHSLSPKILILISLIILPIIVIGTLLINYFVYLPKTRNESFNLAKSEYLIAFIIVLITLLIICGYFVLMVKVIKKIYLDRKNNIFKISSIGFISSFLDTLGVGSFAVAIAGLKAGKIIKNNALLPGTLNLGLGIPNLIAGTVFVAAINVEVVTLILLVLGAIIGSFIGAELTKKISAKYISLVMAVVLALVGILMILTQLNVLPSGSKIGLSSWQLGLAFVLFIIYGGLQAFGIGLYAPALATVALLGMDIKVAFPIMTLASGSAFPLAAYSYYKNNNYQPKTSFGLMLGGSLGVVLAFLSVFVGVEVGLNVKPAVFTNYLKWLAIIVVFYVAVMLLSSYFKIRKKDNNAGITDKKTILLFDNYSNWNNILNNQLDDYLALYYKKHQFYVNLNHETLRKDQENENRNSKGN
ncbi:sulfite exporter TauE/SafE family protein [Spiroplasma endosymbiont of Stenodema calcarata]|uniref:sulfite exporter TauE/SafE family protein n=1 Tax=Spiroplasma endosymbiont of Stenodema calcarata TaxID=3139328 RepID=UPI003CCAF4A5